MTRAWMWVSAVLLGLCQVGASAAEPTHAKLRPVSFGKVTIQDSFWSPRIEANRTVTLPHSLKHCENTGRISNFAKAGKLIEGEFEGIYFNDSDLYKVLEGAAYSLALHPDPQLEARIDSIIDQIASAQQPDGYLNTYFTLKEPDKRWTDLAKMHELYCAGHLFEAAVAYYEATGKRKLLDVACRFADHIDTVFGPGKKIGYSGHEEIELALIKLARVTGEQRYRKLAEWFVEIRGQNRDPKEEYCQAHLPVAEQSEIVGHAVRAMYLYAAVADIAGLTGRRDYIEAMDRLWLNVTGRKLYLTGGIGAEARNEGFSADFDLPNDSAYAETCAAIGLAMWSHRLLLLHGEGRFTDILERTLYNGILSGVAMAGDKFFYVNPLASRGRHHRQPWYGCACCPTNVVRFIPALGGYIYATSDDGATAVRHVDLNDPEQVYTIPPRIDWQASFSTAHNAISETILGPGLARLLSALRNVDFAEPETVKAAYRRLAHRCWAGELALITAADLLAEIAADPDVPYADRQKINQLAGAL